MQTGGNKTFVILSFSQSHHFNTSTMYHIRKILFYFWLIASLERTLLCQKVELYDRLNALLDYVINRPEAKSPDLMLGIYLCEAQFKQIEADDRKHSLALVSAKEKIIRLCNEYEVNANKVDNIWQSSIYHSIVAHHLLNASFWFESLENTNLFLGEHDRIGQSTISLKYFLESIDAGAPSPTQSDECLAELLSNNHCMVSTRCQLIMSPANESHGYHLTHKLLYFMIINYRNCTQNMDPSESSVELIIHTLCSMILIERDTIMAMHIPNVLRDLLVEQTLLCGLAGFLVFLEENIVSKIISWQLSSGCFEYFDEPIVRSKRQKRSVRRLDDNCSDHMTGLAAAVYGLLANIANRLT